MIRRSISLAAIASATNQALLFGLLVLLSHHFAKSDLIVFFLVNDALKMITLCFSGLKDAVIYCAEILASEKKALLYLLLCTLLLALVTLGIGLPLLNHTYFQVKLTDYPYTLFAVELYLLLLIGCETSIYLLQLTRRYTAIALIDTLRTGSFVGLFMMIFFSMNLHEANHALLTSITLACVLQLSVLVVLLRSHFASLVRQVVQKRNLDINFIEFRSFASYAGIATLEYVASYFYLYMTSFILLNLGSKALVADFQVVARPLYMALLTVFTMPVMKFLFLDYTKRFAGTDLTTFYRNATQNNKMLFGLGILLVIVGWSLAPYFVRLFFPASYGGALVMIRILLLGLPFALLNAGLFSFIKSMGKFKQTLCLRLVGMVTFVLAAFVFVKCGKLPMPVIFAMPLSVACMSLAAMFLKRRLLAQGGGHV